MKYINILSAEEGHWKKYFEFYKKQNSTVKKPAYKTVADFKAGKLEQSAKLKYDTFIFCNTRSCKANIFLFGKDDKNKTLNVKINFLKKTSDEDLNAAIIEFLNRLLKVKDGYALIVSSPQKAISGVKKNLNTLENKELFVSRLYRKNINQKIFAEIYKKLKPDFSGFKIKKFINYRNCNLKDYKVFLDNFHSDFKSISEGGIVKITLEDLQKHKNLLKKEKRKRISYVMYANKEIIAATNFEPRSNVIYTSLTGVIKKLRGKNIAEYLKIFSILDLLRAYPQFEYIQTRMNSDNAAINSINDKLGFKTHETMYEFILK